MQMNYEEFCKKMQADLQDYYGEESTVRLQKVNKNNGITLMGITVYEKGVTIFPTMYLESFYQLYEKQTGYSELVRMFTEKYESYRRDSVNMDFFSDYEKVKELLFFKLVHYDMNREFLKEVPCHRYLDLAAVFQCHISNEVLGEGTITVRNEHLKMWHVDTETVYRDALQNMPLIYPCEFMNMAQMLKKMFEDEEGAIMDELPLFVLSNEKRLYGASSLLYQNQLEKIGRLIQDDYYILPSSIHEVLILPKKYGTDEPELSRMVYEINQTHVEPEEVLSNHAYFYARGTQNPVCLPLIPKNENGCNETEEKQEQVV